MDAAPVKVLIVDDEPRNLEALEVMLAPLACTLVPAGSGDEALLAVLQHEFAAMVLDIQMPRMTGIELARLIKQRRRTQDVPILFLTAHLMDDTDVLRGYGVGAVDYLSKPINADILRSKVGVFVDLYRKTHALARLNERLNDEVAKRRVAQEALQEANLELERRVAERTAALTQARDEAERQGRLKDEFLATLSHELRTPMNAILGWLHMLAANQAGDERKALSIIERNAVAQAKLIDDLLQMQVLAVGKARLDLAPTDVAAVLRAAIQNITPTAESKGVRLVLELEPNLPALRADSARLQQILWNLLHNAIKFTPPGGHVTIAVRQTATDLQVVVRDTGQGIPADFLPFVFDRFRQADSSTTRKAWGLGLGLSIVKHLVELHGGTIEAASEGPGRGASFVMTLPRQFAGSAATAGVEEHAS